MDKILEVLSKLLPEDNLKEATNALEDMLAEATNDIEKEYNDKLEEAYTKLSEELLKAEQTAEQGYAEAYQIINDLRSRLHAQRAEFEEALEEGYSEAYEMLKEERSKTENSEMEIYKEFDEKLSEMKSYMTDRLHQFLMNKGQEIYKNARRDIMNDPRMAEHKVVLDKIVEQVADYITDEEYALATGTKLEEATRAISDLRSQMQSVEMRNIQLTRENKKLNETVRHQQEVLTESAQAVEAKEKNERVEKAKNVQGRGKTAFEQIVAEYHAPTVNKTEKEEDNTLVESLSPEFLQNMRILSGVEKNDK